MARGSTFGGWASLTTLRKAAFSSGTSSSKMTRHLRVHRRRGTRRVLRIETAGGRQLHGAVRCRRWSGRSAHDAPTDAKEPGADRAKLQDTILKLAAEVRQQLGLQLNISRTLIDLKVVREFQHSVVEVISEESPEVARRVVARLKERRALRASGTLPALDGGFDVA